MRINGRNLIFIAIGLIVMVALIVLGTRDANAPDGNGDPTETAAQIGPLFPDLSEENVVRFEIRGFEREPEEVDPEEPTATPTPTPLPDVEVETGPIDPGEVIMTKDDENIWTIEEATNSTDREPDQLIIVGAMSLVVGLEYDDRFSLEETGGALEDFGLDDPAYEIVLSDGETDATLTLGDTNPAGQRYYATLNDDTDTVYLVTTSILNNIVDYTLEPPYVPAPTATPTPFPTANPFSEVEQTATAEVELGATATAEAEFMATIEAASATEDVGPAPADGDTSDEDEANEEADADADEDEATEEADSDEGADADADSDEATEDADSDADSDEEDADADATEEANLLDTLGDLDADESDED
jgi:hypothetical protein